MKLSLKNIGKIGTASVEINGITVIAGENNTGKSTVSRALFAVFDSFCRIEEQIMDERIRSVENQLQTVYYQSSSKRFSDIHEAAQDIVFRADEYRNQTEMIKQRIQELVGRLDLHFEKQWNDRMIDEISSRIGDILRITDQELIELILKKKLDAEFNGQIGNIFSEDAGEIHLQIKNQCLNIVIEKNRIVNIQNEIGIHTEAIYMDDPFVLDELSFGPYTLRFKDLGHRGHLKNKIADIGRNTNLVDELIARNKFQNIDDKLSLVCSGEMIQDKQFGFGYKRTSNAPALNVKNLSTGLKTFVILKTLLMNRVIESNGTIILDEPEIHLHPEWQLLFAELIVLIQKEFGLHILLNTHSPYFLNAIEVYAAKYNLADQCKYYLAFSKDNVAGMEDVTDHIESIYKKLARPLQDLENERYRL